MHALPQTAAPSHDALTTSQRAAHRAGFALTANIQAGERLSVVHRDLELLLARIETVNAAHSKRGDRGWANNELTRDVDALADVGERAVALMEPFVREAEAGL